MKRSGNNQSLLFPRSLIISLFLCLIGLSETVAQVDEGETGAWYMYFWSTTFNDGPLGFQGDLQLRNWNLFGDLEQTMLRAGPTYKPTNSNVKFTLGYANIQTGTPGDDDSTTGENRFYFEALLPHEPAKRVFLNHRFRYEVRSVDDQDTRTRFRYNLFVNVALNDSLITKGTIYLAFYNELFINGERSIGNERTIEIFDRNRTYLALGYAMKKDFRLQVGAMRQITENWRKVQLQLSAHHQF